MTASAHLIDHITGTLSRHEYSEETEMVLTHGGHAVREISLGARCACGWKQPAEWDVLDAWDAWTQHTSSAITDELPAHTATKGA